MKSLADFIITVSPTDSETCGYKDKVTMPEDFEVLFVVLWATASLLTTSFVFYET